MDDYQAKTAYRDIEEANSYDEKRFSSIRGRIGDFLDRRAIRKALAWISKEDIYNLIDIPCGTSRISKALIDLGYNVQGADISFEMMENGKQKVYGNNSFRGFVQCDASKTAFPDKSFDCLVCVRFIGHVPKEFRSSIFSEFRRISRYSIIELSIETNIDKLRKIFDRLFIRGAELPKRWGWEVFESSSLEKELNSTGLQIVALWPKLFLFSNSWFLLVADHQHLK